MSKNLPGMSNMYAQPWYQTDLYADAKPPWRRLLLERLLRLTAERTPNARAIQLDDRVTTWGELDELADRAADGLLKTRARPGDVVALNASNTPETLAMMFGVARAGMVVLPLNPMNTRSEIEFQVEDSRAVLMLSDDGMPVADVIRSGRLTRHDIDVSEDAPYWVRFSSGTSGRPRMLANSHRNLTIQAMYCAVEWGYRSDDILLVNAPLAHAAFIFTNAAVLVGAPMVIHQSFGSQLVWEECDRHGITQLFMVPTMVAASLNSPGSGASIRRITVMASTFPPALKAKLVARFPHVDVTEAYGASEGGMITSLSGADAAGHEGSVGLPQFGASVRILDDEGNSVPSRQVGTIYFQGPILPSGYVGSVPPPPGSFRDGWITAGDLGWMDEEGYLYIADRRSDLIISGGLNVYPAEVETVLMEIAGVREAVVVGVPDEKWGQKVTAVVAGNVSADELDGHCRSMLSAYKVPRRYEIMQELPKSPTGKLLRRLVRDTLTAPRA